jgi:hypothetical protein
MPTARIRTAEEFQPSNVSLARVRKPRTKLVACPGGGHTDGGWRLKLFLGADENLYERQRRSQGEGESVERWFIVTSLTAERSTRDDVRVMRKAWKEAQAAQSGKQPSRAERQAKKKNQDEIMCRYSLGVLFGDLLEELDYAILAHSMTMPASESFEGSYAAFPMPG